MKLSKFNHYYTSGDKYYLYNTLSSSLAELEKDEIEILKEINKDNNYKDFSEELEEQFKELGIILEDNTDENNTIIEDMYQSRMNTEHLVLTIAPTTKCNFSCSYCFEKSAKKFDKMDDKTMDSIIEFVKSKSDTINVLSITWYGGEPLLCLDEIDKLSKNLIKICEEKNIDYFASMTTNGILLSSDVFEKLNKNKIQNIQIPLDGMKENHNRYRFTRDNKDSFNVIMNNIKSIRKKYLINSYDEYPKIVFRLNITRQNSNDWVEVLNYLDEEELLKYVQIYIAMIEEPSDIDYKTVLSPAEFLKIRDQFDEKLQTIVKRENSDLELNFPKRIYSTCGCDRENSYVIDPKGNINKCWEEIGNKNHIIGNINKGLKMHKTPTYYDHMLYNPLENKNCSNCSILPICMGGDCPIKRCNGNLYCDIYKKLFDNKMKKLFKYININIMEKIYI